MHYFIIHSGRDYDKVKVLLDDWGASLNRFKCSILKGTQNDWHDDARAKIRSADKVIYFVGELSANNENIDWELDVAIAENKDIYVYKLCEEYALNKILDPSKWKTSIQKGNDGEIVFSSARQLFYITGSEDIKSKLREDDDYISSHLESSRGSDIDVAMKQYEMFVETSEELVRRKQSVNSFYITINSLIISIVLAAFALSEKLNVFGQSIGSSTIIICLSSIVGCIICFSWHSLLQSYADLNSSKMKIISYIETQLAYNLYDTEWQLVSKKMGNRKYKSFSAKEKFIAKLFFALYIILFIVGIIFSII